MGVAWLSDSLHHSTHTGFIASLVGTKLTLSISNAYVCLFTKSVKITNTLNDLIMHV